MLEIKALSVSYTANVPVLKELNLLLDAGKVHGLVGLNGSGKTTLLNCISEMLPYQGGTIRWQGQPLTKAQVAVLETENVFYKKITGREYLQLFQALNPHFALLQWNELFAVPLEKFMEEYSTGMKKKLAFMSVLSFDTPLLILDEPFNGIDLETVQLIKTIIVKLKGAGKTIIITSHMLESLLNICDTVTYLEHKSVRRTYYPAEFGAMEAALFAISNERNARLIDKLINPGNEGHTHQY